MTAEENKKTIQKWTGTVVSDKMAKTIVVKIDRRVTHPKYKKAYTVSKKYKVHDEKNQYKAGDIVTFVGSKKFSKDKKWQVLYK